MDRKTLRRIVLQEMHNMQMMQPLQPIHHHHDDHESQGGKVFHHNGPEAESDMIHSNLWTMKMKACDLYDMIGDRDDLPEWVQEKIAVAGYMIDSVYDYLNYEYNGSESHRGEEHINEKRARRRRLKREG
jgi:hypothetical protein